MDPKRDDALAAVRKATGEDALEYEACTGFISTDFRNLRSRAPLRSGEGLAGPMCLFGEPLVDDGSEEARGRAMDALCGFHVEGEGMVLSIDLGSGRFGMPDVGPNLGDVADGEYRAVVLTDPLMAAMEKSGGGFPTASGRGRRSLTGRSPSRWP